MENAPTMRTTSVHLPRVCRAIALGVIVALGLCAAPQSAVAKGSALDSLVARYRAAPQAALGEQIAKAYRDKGRLLDAANWSERAARSPGADLELRNRMAALREAMRWDLKDKGYGAVIITVSPAEAVVHVDDLDTFPVGRARKVWAKEGAHQLVANAPDYDGQDRMISVTRDSVSRVSVTLRLIRLPTLSLTVEPETATVWIDNVYKGQAKAASFTLPVGHHMVEVRAPDHRSYVRSITLVMGAREVLKLKLDPDRPLTAERHTASEVDRKLTPLELANRGERHRIGGRPDVRSPHDKAGGNAIQRNQGGSDDDGDEADRDGDEDGADGEDEGGGPPALTRAGGGGDDDDYDEPEASEDAGRFEASTSASSGGGGGGSHDIIKGFIWGGAGLALVGAGIGMALYGADMTLAANALRQGNSQYDYYYDTGYQYALIGYGTAGLGAVSMGIGSLYLMGRKGLSRQGIGWSLTTVGVLTAGTGGFLMMQALSLAASANDLAPGHYDYVNRYETAQSQAWTAYVTTGVGAAVLAGGLYLVLTRGGSSAAALGPADAREDEFSWNVRVLPQLSRDRVGGILQLDW